MERAGGNPVRAARLREVSWGSAERSREKSKTRTVKAAASFKHLNIFIPFHGFVWSPVREKSRIKPRKKSDHRRPCIIASPWEAAHSYKKIF
jgi:hypothetical protein